MPRCRSLVTNSYGHPHPRINQFLEHLGKKMIMTGSCRWGMNSIRHNDSRSKKEIWESYPTRVLKLTPSVSRGCISPILRRKMVNSRLYWRDICNEAVRLALSVRGISRVWTHPLTTRRCLVLIVYELDGRNGLICGPVPCWSAFQLSCEG